VREKLAAWPAWENERERVYRQLKAFERECVSIVIVEDFCSSDRSGFLFFSRSSTS